MRTAPGSSSSQSQERRQNLRAAFRKDSSSTCLASLGCCPPVVSIHGNQYLVDFGPEQDPRYHMVNKDKTCSCGAAFCEAIQAVRQYLQAGGMRAPESLDTSACPICGGKTYRNPCWDGKYTKTLGWRCENGGVGHFLQTKQALIQKNLAENPWLYPPKPGYAGVRRDEILTAEECSAARARVFMETGYDPTL
jgi:hypothetical protein